jgi:16S rRNA (cytidine1402-2'-O)-methyltransferase
MGTLYLIATPIGNLEDLSPRAARMLGEVDVIAAEDTRHTRKLLSHFKINTPLTSYFEHNKLSKLDAVLGALRRGDVALVSDGGMPAISDPGYELLRAALAAGHEVRPLPGPSALLAALAASGLPTDAFVYLGFLPRKSSERRRLLAENASDRRTLVVFESPHRLRAALVDIEAELGERPLAVARELTKLYEEIFRGAVSAAREYFSQAPVRGEVTIVIGGCPQSGQEKWSPARVRAALQAALQAGESRALAAKAIAQQSGWPRREVYRLEFPD